MWQSNRLYVLRARSSKVSFLPVASGSPQTTLNSTVNLKDTSQWMESLNPGDILLREIPEASIPESNFNDINCQLAQSLAKFIISVKSRRTNKDHRHEDIHPAPERSVVIVSASSGLITSGCRAGMPQHYDEP